MTMVKMRRAGADDSPGLASVQVDSYRAAYAGLLPEEYLAHFSYEEQEQEWRDWLPSHPDDILLVAENDGGEVVGYALGRPGLAKIAGYESELLALHVRRLWQRMGIGRQLVSVLAGQLKRQGCTSLMLWVLRGNPARAFYEKLGGQLIGEQAITLDERGTTAVEVAYGWRDIQCLTDQV